MDENMFNCCRICLDVESKRVPILADSLLHLQVKSCLPITISTNDNLPKSICEPCVVQLNEFYNFQLNARCSQDWLESSIERKAKNTSEIKLIVQPLPDSEYNSDSLLEFLNNTANIEEYLNNLGKEDIPSIVNMLDRTESSDINRITCSKIIKQPSPKKKEPNKAQNSINMDIDVLDSDLDIVKEILLKETDPKKALRNAVKTFSCFGCKTKLDSLLKLSQHLSICDNALRTCIHCNQLFDSKQKMCQHLSTHCNAPNSNSSHNNPLPHGSNITNQILSKMGFLYSCKQCGDTFTDKLKLYKHARGHIIKSEEKICDICGHVFLGHEVLLKHRKEQHDKPEKFLYRCKVCSFTSPDRKQIYSHVAKHTQVKQANRHLCESCGQSFATQATLNRHSQQHNSELRCHVCHKNFTSTVLKEKHLLEHVEMVMCEKCGVDVNILSLDKHKCV